MRLPPGEAANLARFGPRRRNFFETWYLKWNQPADHTAGWIRYTLFHSKRHGSEAAVWGIFVDGRRPADTVYIKERHPLEGATIDRDRFGLTIGKSGMRHREAWGDVRGSGSSMRWKLRANDGEHLVQHLPWPLYATPVPTTKFLAPLCWYKASGTVWVNGREILVDAAPAHEAHFWGSKQVTSWAWGNCSAFREDPHFGFEGISARVVAGPVALPSLSTFHFLWEGRVHASSGLVRALVNKSRNDLTEWRFEATAGDLRFEGLMRGRPDEMIIYRHLDPDGDERHSHNHFRADLEIGISRRSKSGFREVKRLTADRTAAFEVAQPNRDRRVHHYIHS